MLQMSVYVIIIGNDVKFQNFIKHNFLSQFLLVKNKKKY